MNEFDVDAARDALVTPTPTTAIYIALEACKEIVRLRRVLSRVSPHVEDLAEATAVNEGEILRLRAGLARLDEQDAELARVRAQMGIAAVALGRIADKTYPIMTTGDFDPLEDAAACAREALLRLREET